MLGNRRLYFLSGKAIDADKDYTLQLEIQRLHLLVLRLVVTQKLNGSRKHRMEIMIFW